MDEAASGNAEDEQLWRRLQQFTHNLPRHHAFTLASNKQATQSTRDKEDAMVANLLADTPLSLLFAATNLAFAAFDEGRTKVASEVLLCVFGSATGARLALERPEVLPMMQTGLQHELAALRRLTIGVIHAAMADEPRGRAARCRVLLATPLPPLLVRAVADPSIAVAQAATDCLVDMLRFSQSTDAEALTQPPPHPPQSAGDAGDASASAAGPSPMVVDDTGAGGSAVVASSPVVAAAVASVACDAVLTAVAEAAATATDSTVTLRLAELAARCAALSDSVFEAARQRGALAPLLATAHESDDVMLRLNALELLELLADTPAGSAFLFGQGHVAALLRLAGGDDGRGGGNGGGGGCVFFGGGGSGGDLLQGSALRVLGAIYKRAGALPASAWAEVEPGLARAFLRLVVAHAGSREETTQLAALSAIAAFAGSSVSALAAAVGDDELLDAWLTFDNFKVEVKAAALHSIARVLGPPPPLLPLTATVISTAQPLPGRQVAAGGGIEGGDGAGDGAEDVNAAEERSALCRRLYEQVGPRNGGRPTSEYLLALARRPVPEVRFGAFDVMRCALHQRGGWGLRALFLQTAGYPEFLENRQTEHERPGREWKFSVIEAAVRCPEKAVIGAATLERLETMLRQGPFYVGQPPPDVRTMA